MSDNDPSDAKKRESPRMSRRSLLQATGAAAGAVGVSGYFASDLTDAVEATTPEPPVARWTFDAGSGRTLTEANSGAQASVRHRDDAEPLWIGNGDDGSLLFDGYTTHAVQPVDDLADALGGPFEQLTIDAWVAPRSFSDTSEPDTIVESVDSASPDGEGFRFGASTYGKWLLGVRRDGAWDVAVADEAKLPRYEWSHVTAVFDGTAGAMRLYLDGERVVELTDLATGPITLADGVSLGRNVDTNVIFNAEMFEFDLFDGAVGQLELYDVAFDAGTVADKHEAEKGGVRTTGWEELVIHPGRFDGDPFRPEFHSIPPQHWMNEPHAPLYFDGKYHLFFQHNPKGPYWHHIHWGHWVSTDLVHWEPQPHALAPGEDDLDPTGCWAGDTVLDDEGVPTAFYTGGISRDSDARPDQAITTAKADPSDPTLADWEKSNDLVLPAPPDPDSGKSPYPTWWFDENPDAEYPPHFRDPCVWQMNDEWYCLVGGVEYDQNNTEHGTAWIYRSSDFENWEFEGRAIDVDASEDPFPVDQWELPNVVPLGDDGWNGETFMFCINALWHVDVPEWASHVPSLNKFDVYYWICEWDEQNYEFIPRHEEPRLIDYGDAHFTGCSTMYDADPEKDRSLLFTIAQDYRLPKFHYESGWAHNAGLPMEVSLGDDDRLRVNPIEELRSLRSEKLYEASDADPADVNADLDGVSAETVEIRLELEAVDAEQYGLRLQRTEDGEEETYLVYDEPSETINVDRRASTTNSDLRFETKLQSDLVHSGEIELEGDTLELHLYVDKSLIECYVNSLKSVTTRAYPTRDDADGLRIFYVGDVIVRSMEVWELNGISEDW
jgi:sucrose-6-phosphate hydrolase SacC (GH32 family)